MRFCLAVVISGSLLSACAARPEGARAPSSAAQAPPSSPSRDSQRAEELLRRASEAEKQSRWDEALRQGTEAARLLEPLRDPRLGTAYQLIGRAELESGRCDRASEAYLRAVRARESAFGPEHRFVGISLASLAEARAARGSGNALEWRLIGTLEASLRALGDQAGIAALFAGFPAADYCLPEPCPTTAPARSPAVSAAPEATPGQVDNAVAVVGALRAPFRACYDDALRRDQSAIGKLKVSISVGPDGVPWRVTTRALGFLDAEAVRCVLGVALQARFSAPSGGSAVIQVPITFVRSDLASRSSTP